ncbi:hypothetical protein TrVE_jg12999 [Triparma verrucosa]|jgi:GAF domain-containing protein|uniref:GAF domain-containing protein n=1 Tax=Triparma verrucosa TaxID=1606542 RepID=A0A9W7ELG1_9STRA|nr:hypothetical protein TrVE_jg12999 [Triparma verrucosa]
MAVTPEDAADYLSRTNFKSIIELLTAEAILHRSEDPVLFCRTLLDQKIQARGGAAYAPEQATEYVRQCYADASANADENGRIQGKASSTSGAADVDGLTNRLALLESLIEACRTIATKLDPMEATQAIINQTLKVLLADRATIFTKDPHSNNLILMVAEGARNIRVPIGKGIAGSVAESGVICNIKDAYNDPRFDPSFDRETGYKTKSILCGPIKDQNDNIVGVLQVINKKDDSVFSDLDAEMLTILSTQAGIALKNANLYLQMENSRQKFRSLLDIIAALQSELGTNSLIFTMTQRAPKVVGADRCTIFLVDNDNQELWAMQGEVNIRIPKNAGIAGEVATAGEIVNIPDAYSDTRFNQEVDKKSGYITRSILCMPIKAGKEVVGVIQLLNKDEGPFDEEDEEVMGSFLSIAGPILKSSNLFQSGTGKKAKSDEKSEFPGGSDLSVPTERTKDKAPMMPAFGEDDDEEDDDGGF